MKHFYYLSTLLFLAFALQSNAQSCSKNSSSFNNGTVISFDEVKYNFPSAGYSTWFYKIDNTNGNKGASHTSFVLNQCITQNEFYGGGTYTSKNTSGLNYNNSFVVGIDGSYKDDNLYVIKYDQEVTKGSIAKVFFVLKKNYLSTVNDIFIKPGSTFEFGTLCTPSNSCTPLPVKLLDFKINYLIDAIELNWSTASEINNDGFYIEHSLDGINFTNLAFIKSATNSNELRHYSYKDIQNKSGYYRLRIVDLDGYTEFSGVLYIDENKINSIIIQPNLVKDEFEVVLNNGVINNITIIDVVGKVITDKVSLNINQNTATLNGILLTPGMYHLIINQQIMKKFIKL